MKIGVISDSHGEIPPVERAVGVIDRLNIEIIIHCGDVGEEVIPFLHGRKCHFVHGNMDDSVRLGELLVGPGHVFHDHFGRLEMDGRRIAFLHGHDVKLLHRTINSGEWDLVCHGHTHAFSKHVEGDTVVLNPGALGRTQNPSMAVVDLESLDVTEVSLQLPG